MSPISKGSVITASDLNALVTKINNEDTRRGSASPVGSSATKGDEVGYVLGLDIETIMYGVINQHHCYCEADGGVEVHNGGVDAPDTTPHAIDSGKIEMFRYYDNDIDVMAAQCDCDSFACSCVAQCSCQTFCNCESNCTCETACNCNSGNCSGQHLCSCDTNCTCNTDCLCDTLCLCNSHWFDMCGDEWWHCICDADCPANCTCELNSSFYCECEDVCGCNTHCICDNLCGCNYDCTCDDDCLCNTDCGVDAQCDCEFGG